MPQLEPISVFLVKMSPHKTNREKVHFVKKNVPWILILLELFTILNFAYLLISLNC